MSRAARISLLSSGAKRAEPVFSIEKSPGGLPDRERRVLNCEFKKSDDGGVILFTGELTAKHAAELRNALIKALVDADRIGMDFGNVTVADLSCFQLLCSAHRIAQRLNKRLCFVGRTPEALTTAMEEAGFTCLTGCSLDCDRGCLRAVPKRT